MSNTNPYESPNAEQLPISDPSGESFTLSGCLTVADSIAAHRLVTYGSWYRVILAIAVVFLFSVSVFAIVLIALAVSFRPYGPQTSNAFLLTAIILVALLVVPSVRGRLQLRSFARRQFGMFAPTESVFTAEKIVTASDSAKSEFEWSLFSGFRANETIALLFFYKSKQHLILARSKLQNSNEWPSLLALIESRLTKA